MIRPRARSVVLALLWLLWLLPGLPRAAGAEAKAKENPDARFLRVARDDKGRPTALEAAIVRFVPAKGQPSGPTVDLIAAVHIADKSFYDQLNHEFEQYDVVLYEMVAPEGTRPQPGEDGHGGSPLSAVQTSLTELLELEFQLKGIDYTCANFVHADMSPEEFAQSMRDREESLLSIALRMMGYAMAREGKRSPGGGGSLELLAAFLDNNRAMALKRLLAQQFEELSGMTAVLDGTTGSTLISERNKKVMEALRRQIDAGKKKIAIFYGAGHMSDMAKRLQADFGLVRGETRWLKAWELGEERKPLKENDKENVRQPRAFRHAANLSLIPGP